MASPPHLGHGRGMNQSHQSHDFAESAQTLRRAAAEFEQRAATDGSSAALPEALEHLKETLELLARGVEKASQAIADPTRQQAVSIESDLSAGGLRWHLSHLSARLLRARDVCPPTRRWADRLLAERDGDPAPDDVVTGRPHATVAA